jgi:diamine N-acetyltransferase
MRIHLRPVTKDSLRLCLNLAVAPDQEQRVASVAASLAQAYVDPNLHPYAVYDARAIGYEQTDEPLIGFAVLEVAAGVGFILRLMVDAEHQGRGYGRAIMVELIRRAYLFPDVQLIATSHQRGNLPMERLCKSLGFVPWEVSYASEDGPEVYLRLEHTTD